MGDLGIFIGAVLIGLCATAYTLHLFWKAGWLTFRWPWKR